MKSLKKKKSNSKKIEVPESSKFSFPPGATIGALFLFYFSRLKPRHGQPKIAGNQQNKYAVNQ